MGKKDYRIDVDRLRENIRKFRRGDEDAGRDVLCDLYSLAYIVAIDTFDKRSNARIDDEVHDLILWFTPRLRGVLKRLNLSGNVWKWLYQRVRWQFSDNLRRRVKFESRELDAKQEIGFRERKLLSISAMDQAIGNELLFDYETALEALTSEYRFPEYRNYFRLGLAQWLEDGTEDGFHGNVAYPAKEVAIYHLRRFIDRSERCLKPNLRARPLIQEVNCV